MQVVTLPVSAFKTAQNFWEISADILALNAELAKEYLPTRQKDTEMLCKEIAEKKGQLGYASVCHFVSPEQEAKLVNGEWCDNMFCALAYILKKWW